jgi:hypothetical protein
MLFGAISLAAIQCFQAKMSGGVSRRLSQPVTDILFGP